MINKNSFRTFVDFTSQGASPGQSVSPTNIYARVVHVVQGPNLVGSTVKDPYYSDETSIGSITFQLMKGNQVGSVQSQGNNIAYPYQSNIKIYPLEGEIVELVTGPSKDMNDDYEAPQTYYKTIVSLWNSNHHNAFPSMEEYADFTNSPYLRSYEETQADKQPSTLQNSTISYPLGPNFIEKADVKTLYPFAGDFILEGRYGNSIRFGSTQYYQRDLNIWSRDSSSLGNPITIIRNGQGRQIDTEGWVPTVENINRDPSSIYLTQGQRIDIDDITKNFKLETLDVTFAATYTAAIPVQQALVSIDSLSPTEQDERVRSVSEPAQAPTPLSSEPEPDLQVVNPPPTTATVETTTTIVSSSSPNVTPPTPTALKGTYLRDYTNTAGQVFELYSSKKGFNTTIYAYKKDSGVLVKSGTPSSTAELSALIREMELSLQDNSF